MAGIIPELTNGAKVVRDGTGACVAPSGVANAYCPPAAFTSTCEIKALPNDCTAFIVPAQINALVSEMLALAARMTPNGTWNCASVTNLADAFAAWRTGFGAVDNVTIGGAGTTASPYHAIADGIVAAICSDNSAHDQLASCLLSTDVGNGLALGADGGIIGAGSSTDDTIDGVGSPANPFRVNLAKLVTAICGSNAAHDALAQCLISTDVPNGLRAGTDGGLVAPRTTYYNAGTVTGSANAWAANLTPTLLSAADLVENAIVVATMAFSNTSTAVTASFDGVNRSVRLGDGTVNPPVGYFKVGHSYMLRFDQTAGAWAAVSDLTDTSGPATVTPPDGNVIYADAPPTAADGLVGDYWFDVPNNRWYGPKVAVGWVANDFIGSDIYNLGLLGGTATAYTAVSPRPDMPNTGQRDGSIAFFRVNVTNTGNNPTLAVSGGAARGLRRGDGSNIVASDLIANHDIMAVYNGPTSRWRCVMDLTTGKPVGEPPASGPQLLASGSGTYASNALLTTVTDVKHTRYTLVLQCKEEASAHMVLSDDNGATWYTGSNDYTREETNGGTWTINSSNVLVMQPTGAGSYRAEGAPVGTAGTVDNAFARLAIDGFFPGVSCAPFSRGVDNQGNGPEPLVHATVKRVYNAFQVRFGHAPAAVATQFVNWRLYGEY